MHLDNTRSIALIICIVVSFASVGIKLFSSQFFYSDAPDTGIMLRYSPSLDNYIENPSPGNGVVILRDENSFRGEIVYHFIVGWMWFAVPIVTFLLAAGNKWFKFIVKGHLYNIIPLIVTAAALSLFCGLLVKIVANHGQLFFNHLFGIAVSAGAAIVVVICQVIGHVNRWTKMLLIINSILVLLYISAYYTNIVLPYETWLEKNMPESGIQKLNSK